MIYLGLGGALLLLLLLPAFADPWLVNVFIMIFYYAYLGQCWNILTGYAGQISLGHAAFFGIGAYTSTLLAASYGLSPWIGMVAGGALATVGALFIGFLGFRFGVRGVYFAILTLAFAEILRVITLNVEAFGTAVGLFITFKGHQPLMFQFQGKTPYYYIALGLLLLSVGVVYLISRSKLGYRMVSVREDEDAAESLGISGVRTKLTAITISAFFTAFAGTFYAQYFLYIQPDISFGVPLSIEIILRPIIGGTGTVLGPVLGSFVLTPVAELSRFYLAKGGLEGLHLVLYGAIMAGVVMFMPRGIMGYIVRLVQRHR